jgi:hypothetical protein
VISDMSPMNCVDYIKINFSIFMSVTIILLYLLPMFLYCMLVILE